MFTDDQKLGLASAQPHSSTVPPQVRHTAVPFKLEFIGPEGGGGRSWQDGVDNVGRTCPRAILISSDISFLRI